MVSKVIFALFIEGINVENHYGNYKMPRNYLGRKNRYLFKKSQPKLDCGYDLVFLYWQPDFRSGCQCFIGIYSRNPTMSVVATLLTVLLRDRSAKYVFLNLKLCIIHVG